MDIVALQIGSILLGAVGVAFGSARVLWTWHRRRRSAGSDIARRAVERVQGIIKTGAYVEGCGAFSKGGRNARDAVSAATPRIIDGRLRRLLNELVATYDAAKAAAIPAPERSGVDWSHCAPFLIVAAEFDPSHPRHHLLAQPDEVLKRISTLERRAAGLR